MESKMALGLVGMSMEDSEEKGPLLMAQDTLLNSI